VDIFPHKQQRLAAISMSLLNALTTYKADKLLSISMRESLLIVIIKDIEDAESPSILLAVTHKIGRPGMIGKRRNFEGFSNPFR